MMNVLDLFSGIGGFSLGLEWTGHFKTVGFCEVDDKAATILKRRWPDVPVFYDIRNLKKDMIHEEIDVICGGFPCQDISLIGKGAGLVGERSGLWYEMLRLVNEIRPKYVIAENVAALRSRGLDEVLRSLASIGYDAEWHCLPAYSVGAPHRRDRIWIVAYPVVQGLERHARNGSNIGNQEQDGSTRPPCLRSWGRPCGWWSTEPDVGRVAHGIPHRVDRLKQLGNSVIPHIPMMIGQAIHDHHSNAA
jgi:DNA (cytosine-5)-methyltransferase 1